LNKLRDMDLFVRVVKNLGLAAAGREVGLSPASISLRINALEDHYKTRLLNRSTRHISVTEAGQRFYEACLSILAEVDEIDSEILGDHELLTGSIRITASSDLGHQHVAPVISKFIQDHPDVSPYLHLSDGIVNIINEGFDCGIRYGEMPDSNLIAQKIASSRRVLCASPDYLKRKGVPKTPQDLYQHECLTTTRGSEPMTNWRFNVDGKEEIIAIKGVCSSNDGHLVRRWAIEGVGIALKSYLEIIEDINQGGLAIVLEEFMTDFLKNDTPNTDLYVVYPSRQFRSKRFKVFIDYLKEYFNNLDYGKTTFIS